MRPGYGQLLFYATLLVVMLFNALMTGLTICHVLRKYPSASRHITVQWCTKVSAYVVVFSVVRISSLLNRGKPSRTIIAWQSGLHSSKSPSDNRAVRRAAVRAGGGAIPDRSGPDQPHQPLLVRPQ